MATTVQVNGKTYSVPDGANISTINGVLYVNGEKYDGPGSGKDEDKHFEIVVTGGAVSVKVERGNVTVNGDVLDGGVNAGGSVTCRDVAGKVDAGGSVTCNNVTGDVDAGGTANVGGDVGGSVDAGGSVKCGKIAGKVDAGGSVRHG